MDKLDKNKLVDALKNQIEYTSEVILKHIDENNMNELNAEIMKRSIFKSLVKDLESGYFDVDESSDSMPTEETNGQNLLNEVVEMPIA